MAKKSQKEKNALVIVESPAKARTINRYLGPDYQVMASMGHVRDLPPNELGIDLQSNFEPVYELLRDKMKIVTGLKKAASKARKVYLATDLDREGEAIAWHLVSALGLDEDRAERVVFNEITRTAIQHAFAAPRHLDMDKVNAQQARRVLDRIVGYQLSPLLQSKLGRGLSAGRVQSVAVRLIVAREEEIRNFVPEESWRIFACLATEPDQVSKHAQAWQAFLKKFEKDQNGPTTKERNAWLSEYRCLYAELVKLNGKEFRPASVQEARDVAEALGYVTEKVVESEFEPYTEKGLKKTALQGRTDPSRAPAFTVEKVQRKRSVSRPNPPFTTASLQQAASTSLGFAPARTMRVAQQLYEGLDLGNDEGSVGLITYMRTDSTNLSADAVNSVRELIEKNFGAPYLPDKPNVFASGKRSQEAHEAIRPTDASLTPESLRKKLSSDQYKLYDLIWRRFVACQMTPAQWDTTTILIHADTPRGTVEFKATGRTLVFDGFLRVMRTSEQEDVVLPEIKPQARVGVLQIDPQQQWTSPPPRYTEASLVKKLEAEGIGRPSTYAAIIQTIQDRSYVKLIDKKLQPTERGQIVTQKLIDHFPDVMDLKFTSYMEEELDKIEEAHLDWIHVLNEFYGPFKRSLDKAHVEMERDRSKPSDYTCPECGRPMVYRIGRNGRFLACSGYPECSASQDIDDQGRPVEVVHAKEPCKRCGKPMILRRSRMGPFLGCTGYPECDNMLPCDENGVPLQKVKPEEIQEKCPECGAAMSVKFARGRAFLGCSAYPKCKTTRPIPPGVYVEKPKPEEAGARCDKCGRNMVIRKSRRGPFLSCSGFPRCRNAMPLDKLEELRRLEAEGKIPDPPPENNNGKRNGVQNAKRKSAGSSATSRRTKVDLDELGSPPPGFAWTRTGKPVVETWPEEPLTCPDCGKEVTLKKGRFGPYFGCSAYPQCSFVANLRGDAKKRAAEEMPTPPKPPPVPTDIACDECGKHMVIRIGRTGPFLGCSSYPKCRFSRPLPEGYNAPASAGSARRD